MFRPHRGPAISNHVLRCLTKQPLPILGEAASCTLVWSLFTIQCSNMQDCYCALTGLGGADSDLTITNLAVIVGGNIIIQNIKGTWGDRILIAIDKLIRCEALCQGVAVIDSIIAGCRIAWHIGDITGELGIGGDVCTTDSMRCCAVPRLRVSGGEGDQGNIEFAINPLIKGD